MANDVTRTFRSLLTRPLLTHLRNSRLESKMLSTHKKHVPPRWQRRLVIILGGLFAATFLLIAVWVVILFAGGVG